MLLVPGTGRAQQQPAGSTSAPSSRPTARASRGLAFSCCSRCACIAASASSRLQHQEAAGSSQTGINSSRKQQSACQAWAATGSRSGSEAGPWPSPALQPLVSALQGGLEGEHIRHRRRNELVALALQAGRQVGRQRRLVDRHSPPNGTPGAPVAQIQRCPVADPVSKTIARTTPLPCNLHLAYLHQQEVSGACVAHPALGLPLEPRTPRLLL